MATRPSVDTLRAVCTKTTIEEMDLPLLRTPKDGERLVFSGLNEIDYRGFCGREMIGQDILNVKCAWMRGKGDG